MPSFGIFIGSVRNGICEPCCLPVAHNIESAARLPSVDGNFAYFIICVISAWKAPLENKLAEIVTCWQDMFFELMALETSAVSRSKASLTTFCFAGFSASLPHIDAESNKQPFPFALASSAASETSACGPYRSGKLEPGRFCCSIPIMSHSVSHSATVCTITAVAITEKSCCVWKISPAKSNQNGLSQRNSNIDG